MGRFRALLAGILVTASFFVTSACETESSSSDVPKSTATDPDIPFSNVWSTDDGVDLFGRAAELVRASTEAGEFAAFFGGLGATYPGYQQAVSGQGVNNVDEVFVREVSSRSAQKPRTLFRHITDLAASPDSVEANVCTYAIYPNPGRDDAPPNTGQFALQGAFAVELANSGTDAGRPGIQDTEPNMEDPRAHRPPTWDVFGSWRIEKLRVIEPSQLSDGCARWWRQQFPDSYQDPGSNIVRVPADIQIPTQPVAVQYPEWIGPAKPE